MKYYSCAAIVHISASAWSHSNYWFQRKKKDMTLAVAKSAIAERGKVKPANVTVFDLRQITKKEYEDLCAING